MANHGTIITYFIRDIIFHRQENTRSTPFCSKFQFLVHARSSHVAIAT